MQLADILILALVIFMAANGYRSGLFLAAVSVLGVAIPFVVAMTFYEPLAGLIGAFASERTREAMMFCIVCFGGAIGLHQVSLTYLSEEGAEHYRLVDKVGGLAMGAVAGAVAGGAVLFAWSLMPFAYVLPVNTDAMKFDMGAKLLRGYYRLTLSAGGDRRFPLAVAWCEPILKDVNGNGLVEESDGDEYDDLNSNGKWDSHECEPVTKDENKNDRYDADGGDEFKDLNQNDKWDTSVLWRYKNAYTRPAAPEEGEEEVADSKAKGKGASSKEEGKAEGRKKKGQADDL